MGVGEGASSLQAGGGGDAPLVMICSTSSSMTHAVLRLPPVHSRNSCLLAAISVFPSMPASLNLTQSRQLMPERRSVLNNSPLVRSQAGLEKA